MHNRTGPAVDSFELSLRDGLVLVPLVLAHRRLRAVPQRRRSNHAEAAVKRAVRARAAGRTARSGQAAEVRP